MFSLLHTIHRGLILHLSALQRPCVWWAPSKPRNKGFTWFDWCRQKKQLHPYSRTRHFFSFACPFSCLSVFVFDCFPAYIWFGHLNLDKSDLKCAAMLRRQEVQFRLHTFEMNEKNTVSHMSGGQGCWYCRFCCWGSSCINRHAAEVFFLGPFLGLTPTKTRFIVDDRNKSIAHPSDASVLVSSTLRCTSSRMRGSAKDKNKERTLCPIIICLLARYEFVGCRYCLSCCLGLTCFRRTVFDLARLAGWFSL